jgi:hypothetical protein
LESLLSHVRGERRDGGNQAFDRLRIQPFGKRDV